MVNDILVTLNNIQLEVGFVVLIMEEARSQIDYVDQGLLALLRGRMGEIEATAWIEKAWVPQATSGKG